MPPHRAEMPPWVQGTCVGIRKEEWEPGGGKSLIASSRGVSMRMAALGATAWLEPHRSTPCCPARRDGQKDEGCLIPYQGCPSWDNLSLGL